MNVRQNVSKEVAEKLDVDPSFVAKLMRQPNDSTRGDLALPCQPFEKAKKMKGTELAESLAKELQAEGIKHAYSEGSFLNLWYDMSEVGMSMLEQITSNPTQWGESNVGEGQKVILDYSAPNWGKPMHVGHIRSTILGDAMTRTLRASGHQVHGINYMGDTGYHMGKLLAAIDLWGDKDKLNQDPEKAMFDLYVRFSQEEKENPERKKQAKEVLQKLEAEDPETTQRWREVGGWSQDAFQRVYDLLDIGFEETTGQSKFSGMGKGVVQWALEEGLAQFASNVDDEDAEAGSGVVVTFPDSTKLPPKIILRSDGTAIYATQDIGAAVHRAAQHSPDKMIYIVGSEQELYFRQLFQTLDQFGYSIGSNSHHMKFGHIELAEGRMSTREGNVVFLEDVVGKSIDLARKRLESSNVPEAELEETAQALGLGSLKYQVLHIDPAKKIQFSWDKAFDTSGRSAPYIQYAHVRAANILPEEFKPDIGNVNADVLERPEVRGLIRSIIDFPDVVAKSATEMRPHLLANYVHEVAQQFSEFYHGVRVRGHQAEQTLQNIVYANQATLANGAGLLGIRTPSKM